MSHKRFVFDDEIEDLQPSNIKEDTSKSLNKEEKPMKKSKQKKKSNKKKFKKRYLLLILLALIIAFTNISVAFDLKKLPLQYGVVILVLMLIYAFIIQVYKKIYLKTNKEWL